MEMSEQTHLPIQGARHTYAIAGIDGEGYFNTEDNTHIYDVFTSGDVTLYDYASPLSLDDVASVLRAQTFKARSQNAVFVPVGFFLNYDFTQMLRSLDEYSLNQLMGGNANSRTFKTSKMDPLERGFKPSHMLHVNHDFGREFSPERYRVSVSWGKHMEFSFPTPESIVYAKTRRDESLIDWVTIRVQDIGSIFGCSFQKALKSLNVEVSDDEWEQLNAGKADRAINATYDERDSTVDEVIAYNQLEIDLMYRLFVKLVSVLDSLDIHPELDKDFDGIGSLARFYLHQQAMKENSGIMKSWEVARTLGPEVYKAANDSYYGGWMECLRAGIHKNVWSYDINSAYPHAMRNLPNLKDATVEPVTSWTEVRKVMMNDPDALVLIDVEWNKDSEYDYTFCGGLPYRMEDGSILRPAGGRGWHWAKEVTKAVGADLIDTVRVIKGYHIKPKYDDKPFKYVEQLYYDRLEVGKSTAMGQVMKLIMNAQYGKLAQRIGNPQWANPVYASLITSSARCQILDAYAEISQTEAGASHLIAVATDAIYVDKRLEDLSLTNKLGDWEEEHYSELFYLKAGIWGGTKAEDNFGITDSSVNESKLNEWSVKTRGISLQAFMDKLSCEIIPALERFADNEQWDETFSVSMSESFSMITMSEAYARGSVKSGGEFTMGHNGVPESVSTMNFTLQPKRQCPTYIPALGFMTYAPEARYTDAPNGGVMLKPSTTSTAMIGNVDYDALMDEYHEHSAWG